VFVSFLVFSAAAYCAELKEITVPSRSMGKKFKASIVFPSSYFQSDRRYSVIYLLHGFGGDHTVWPRLVRLDRYADSLRVIFVCPFGGNSWYINSSRIKKSLFETYIIREVCPFVDSAYRTLPRAEGRAIIGTSMGGHGAISLLAKHPEVFSGACSIAGIMDLTEFPLEWNLQVILGPLEKNGMLWAVNSSVYMTGLLKKHQKLIILDCGTGDFALQGNRRMDSLLHKSGIAHFFYSWEGSHDWSYVSAHAPQHIFFMAAQLLPPE